MLDPQGSKAQADPMVCCGRRVDHVRSVGPFIHYHECRGCGREIIEHPGAFLQITEAGVTSYVGLA